MVTTVSDGNDRLRKGKLRRRNSEQNGPNPRYQDAKNLQEFLDVCPDIEILSISHKPGKEIKCKICDEYLHCKPGILKATASRLPTGKDAGCLSTGLKIDGRHLLIIFRELTARPTLMLVYFSWKSHQQNSEEEWW